MSKPQSPTPPRDVRSPADGDLDAARQIVGKLLRPTPLVTAGGTVPAWLKLETMQPTGAFKVRGAFAAVARVARGQEVLAVSAGNHALGIAHAAAVLGVPATIVIAATASARKRALLEDLPIRLVVAGGSYDEAEAHGLELARAEPDRYAFVSGYNDPHVIAGQSTIVDELIAQAPADRPLTIVVPAGGGGLVCGIAIRAAHLATRARPIRVIGVEAERSRALSTAVAQGAIVEVPVGETIADGLAGNLEPGSVTTEILRTLGISFVAIEEAALWAALRALAFDHGLIVEGAGAAAFAAVRERLVPVDRDETIVAILTGRNIAPDVLRQVLGA